MMISGACETHHTKDRHHYVSSDMIPIPVEVCKERDNKKKELAAAKGISLITVPCWWDGQAGRCALSRSCSSRLET